MWTNFNPNDTAHGLIERMTVNDFGIVVCVDDIDSISSADKELTIVGMLCRVEIRDVDFIKKGDGIRRREGFQREVGQRSF
jgi:hypothetical protein